MTVYCSRTSRDFLTPIRGNWVLIELPEAGDLVIETTTTALSRPFKYHE